MPTVHNRFGRLFELDRSVEEYQVFYIGHEGQTLTNLMLSYNRSQVREAEEEEGGRRREEGGGREEGNSRGRRGTVEGCEVMGGRLEVLLCSPVLQLQPPHWGGEEGDGECEQGSGEEVSAYGCLLF